MIQQQASMMLMMHIILMKLPKFCLQKGSFDLTKWITNNENLQHHTNEHEIDYKLTDDYQKLGL